MSENLRVGIMEAVRQNDMVTAAVLNWRYAPGNLTAKRAIEEGQIGNILDVNAEWRINWMSPEFIEQRPWIKDFAISDGILGEGVSHDLDRIRFLTGQDFKKVVSKLVSRPLAGVPNVELKIQAKRRWDFMSPKLPPKKVTPSRCFLLETACN